MISDEASKPNPSLGRQRDGRQHNDKHKHHSRRVTKRQQTTEMDEVSPKDDRNNATNEGLVEICSST
jgi:hypothetical protein